MTAHSTTTASARSNAGHGPDQAAQVWLLGVLLLVAFTISVVHYTDNVVNIADYPRTTSIPNPEGWFVGLMWVPFTASALAGFVWFRREGPSNRALLSLAFYSGSGLIGAVHYAGVGALGMPWWRHTHIIADVLSGAAIFTFVLVAALRR